MTVGAASRSVEIDRCGCVFHVLCSAFVFIPDHSQFEGAVLRVRLDVMIPNGPKTMNMRS